jgi:hypothetical protein
MNFIKEMQENKEKAIDKVVELIVHGIEGAYLVRKLGYDTWKKHMHYNRPCISFAFGTANSNEIQSTSKVDISIFDNMSEIERRVNTKLGVRAIEYRVDRRNHYFKLIV